MERAEAFYHEVHALMAAGENHGKLVARRQIYWACVRRKYIREHKHLYAGMTDAEIRLPWEIHEISNKQIEPDKAQASA